MRVLLLSADPTGLTVLRERLSRDTRISHYREQGWAQVRADAEKPEDLAVGEIELADIDLLVLDGPPGTGLPIDELEALCRRYPQTLVMLLSRREDASEIVAAVGAGVREILRWPADAADIDRAIGQCLEKIGGVGTQRHGEIIAVIASKGGSGATFVAANLAAASAADFDRRTLIIDFDLQYGDASFALGKEPQGSNVVAVLQDDNLDAAFLEAACLPLRRNLSLLASPFSTEVMTSIDAGAVGRLLSLAAQAFDIVVIDLPPQLDRAAAAVMSQSNRILQVVTPSVAALRNQQRQRRYLNELGVPLAKLAVVLNKMPARLAIGSGTAAFTEEVASRLGEDVIGRIPFDDDTATLALAAGESVLEVHRNEPVSRAIMDLARVIFGVGAAPAGWRQRVEGWLRRDGAQERGG